MSADEKTDLDQAETFLRDPAAYRVLNDWSDKEVPRKTADRFWQLCVDQEEELPGNPKRRSYRKHYIKSPLGHKLMINEALNTNTEDSPKVEEEQLQFLATRYKPDEIRDEKFARALFTLGRDRIDKLIERCIKKDADAEKEALRRYCRSVTRSFNRANSLKGEATVSGDKMKPLAKYYLEDKKMEKSDITRKITSMNLGALGLAMAEIAGNDTALQRQAFVYQQHHSSEGLRKSKEQRKKLKQQKKQETVRLNKEKREQQKKQERNREKRAKKQEKKRKLDEMDDDGSSSESEGQVTDDEPAESRAATSMNDTFTHHRQSRPQDRSHKRRRDTSPKQPQAQGGRRQGIYMRTTPDDDLPFSQTPPPSSQPEPVYEPQSPPQPQTDPIAGERSDDDGEERAAESDANPDDQISSSPSSSAYVDATTHLSGDTPPPSAPDSSPFATQPLPLEGDIGGNQSGFPSTDRQVAPQHALEGNVTQSGPADATSPSQLATATTLPNLDDLPVPVVVLPPLSALSRKRFIDDDWSDSSSGEDDDDDDPKKEPEGDQSEEERDDQAMEGDHSGSDPGEEQEDDDVESEGGEEDDIAGDHRDAYIEDELLDDGDMVDYLRSADDDPPTSEDEEAQDYCEDEPAGHESSDENIQVKEGELQAEEEEVQPVEEDLQADDEASDDDSMPASTEPPEQQAPRTPRKSVKHTKSKSPFFESPYLTPKKTPKKPTSPESPRPPAGTVSCLPFPRLKKHEFGLVQEKLADNPYLLLLACVFLQKTAATYAIPVFYELGNAYPLPEQLAKAKQEDVVDIIRSLGFQNSRARSIVRFAQAWLDDEPRFGRRHRTLHYPTYEDGEDIKRHEVLDNDDPRTGAFEVAHLPGVGPYGWDSWRIFCRDTSRGLAYGSDGEYAKVEGQDFEPEWKRVNPKDKELRAFIRWKWLQDGWLWNSNTSTKSRASKGLLEKARAGTLEWDDEGDPVFDRPTSPSPTGTATKKRVRFAAWAQEFSSEEFRQLRPSIMPPTPKKKHKSSRDTQSCTPGDSFAQNDKHEEDNERMVPSPFAVNDEEDDDMCEDQEEEFDPQYDHEAFAEEFSGPTEEERYEARHFAAAAEFKAAGDGSETEVDQSDEPRDEADKSDMQVQQALVTKDQYHRPAMQIDLPDVPSDQRAQACVQVEQPTEPNIPPKSAKHIDQSTTSKETNSQRANQLTHPPKPKRQFNLHGQPIVEERPYWFPQDIPTQSAKASYLQPIESSPHFSSPLTQHSSSTSFHHSSSASSQDSSSRSTDHTKSTDQPKPFTEQAKPSYHDPTKPNSAIPEPIPYDPGNLTPAEREERRVRKAERRARKAARRAERAERADREGRGLAVDAVGAAE